MIPDFANTDGESPQERIWGESGEMRSLKVKTFKTLKSLKSLNFKTFKTPILDLVCKNADNKERALQIFHHKIWLNPKPLSIEMDRNW